jgi:hypothetical protein
MADTGWKFPGTVVADTGPQNGTWYDPDFVKASDDQRAAYNGNKGDGDQPGETPSLTVTNFGFAVPAGNMITGIETRAEGYTENATPEMVNLTVDSTLKREEWTDSLSATDILHVYGDSTDKWGAILTWDIVNDSSFGWVFMIYSAVSPHVWQLDALEMKIYYEPPPPIIIAMGT